MGLWDPRHLPQDDAAGGAVDGRLVPAGSLLDSVLQTMQAGVIVRGADGRVLMVSERARELLGVTFDVVNGTAANKPGWRMTDLEGQPVDPNDLPGMRTLRTGIAYTNVPVVYEHATGRRVVISISSRRAELPTGEQGVVVAFVDETERYDAEAAREEALAEAERASKVKSDFLEVVSHELHTPLNGVVGMLDQLQETQLDEDQAASLDIARASAANLERMIAEILQVSTLRAGREHQQRSVVDLCAVVASICDRFRSEQVARDVSIRVEATAAAGALVDADREQLARALSNVVSNAIEHAPPGTVVEIEIDHPEPDHVRVRVGDRGRGIPTAMLETVFEAFHQVDQVTTRQRAGLGVGLWVSRSIIERCGGTIQARSRRGGGTTFEIVLPSVATRAASTVSRSSPMHVLVVEDNPINQVVVDAQLRSLGHDVTVAASGSEALDVLLNRGPQFDVVLMDCQMPGMSGFECTRRIREAALGGAAGGAIPIVALTASAFADDRQRCLAAGMDGFLAKPIRKQELQAALTAVYTGGTS